MRLTNDQIEIIKGEIDKSSIRNQELRDNVIDHICCVVEVKMGGREDFDTALNAGLLELAPNGLDELQRETIFLLKSHNIIIMKRIMYIVGLLSAMSFILGWTFAMMRWPGASKLSVVGFLGFAFVFVPLYTIDYFKVRIHRVLSEKLRLALGIISAILVGTAVIFKLLHLQGADVLLLLGAGVFVFGFLPFLFFGLYKKSIS